jgi:hypothetical protein
VLLLEAGYTQFKCAKEGIVLRGAGGCEMLCEIAHNSEFSEKGIRVSVRGTKAEEGVMSAQGWQHAKRVLATLDKLLKQWPGMMVFKYDTWWCSARAREIRRTARCCKRSRRARLARR